MKEYPQSNYPIKIFRCTAEYEGPDSKYFEGIYEISLNRTFQITLSPSYDFTSYDFPPSQEKVTGKIDFDNVINYNQARVWLVLFGHGLILLEKEDQAGQLIKVKSPPSKDNSYISAKGKDRYYYIYCISSEDYKLFASELEEIMDMGFYNTAEKNSTDARMEFMVLENLKVYKCINLIHTIISRNRYILPSYKREMLCLE
jgi:hypothetical protein